MSGIQLPQEALYNIGVKAAILTSEGRMLLLHITREDSTDTYWDLPGGRVIDGEEPEQTLRREVREETGISSFSIDRHLVMAIGDVHLPVFDKKKVGVVFSVYQCHGEPLIEKPEERISMHWCTIPQAVINLKTNPSWPQEVIAQIAALQQVV